MVGQHTTLIILCGPSASGKDTTAKALEERLHNTHRVVSATTRPPRENEMDGIDYYFISREQFLKEKDKGGFLECSEFRGWYYGTPSAAIKRDMINILVLNPRGVYDILDNADKLPRGTRIYVFCIDVPFRVRLKRSIDRENGFKWEYIRRAITDWKDFHSFYYWIEKNQHYAVHDLSSFYSPSGHKYYSTNNIQLVLREIKGLPESNICSRILGEMVNMI